MTGLESFDDYFDALASSEPTPGGGSAAAVVAMTAAALVAMVARITAGAPRFTGVHFIARTFASEADALRNRLAEARVHDETAYAAVAAAMKLPKETGAQKLARTAAMQSALVNAAAAPLDIASLALEVSTLAERALELGNAALASDLGCAAEFALSATRAAAYNVRVNHLYIRDTALVEEQAADVNAIELAAAAAAEHVRNGVREALSR